MGAEMSFPASYRENLLQTIQTIDEAKVSQAIEWFREARDQGRAIFVAGNGGSAATASHFVCDMMKGASLGKPSRFRIQALHDSMPTLTAYANDLHYQEAAVEQLKNFAVPGDIYMAISGSGNSQNVIRAMDYANSLGLHTLALTGRDGGKLGAMAELNIQVPEQHMGRIEDAHHIICHMICYCFMDTEPRQ
jgi:D-sedoheptulose 7-phosphate isomerase